MKILLVFIILMCFSSVSKAQKEKHWLLKVGVNRSNLYYNQLPSMSGFAVLLTGDTISTTGFGGGWYQPRWGANVMGYYEKSLHSWLNIGFGMGYRQKGYNKEKEAYRGKIIDTAIAVRFHYWSSELSLRLKPTKHWYFLLNNRFDVLVTSQNPPSEQYLIDNMKPWEVFSSAGLGYEFAMRKHLGLVEIEAGRSLSNVSNFSSNLQGINTQIWNVSYSLNFGVKF